MNLAIQILVLCNHIVTTKCVRLQIAKISQLGGQMLLGIKLCDDSQYTVLPA